MAENPRFNNSGMFTNINSDDYSDITPDSTSEVLATQGNVINSIKVFWNKLRAKLAYAISRPNTTDAVGGHYQPVYIDEHGVVQVCAPETITATIESGSKINIGNIPVHPGKTICVRLSGSFGGSATALKIGNTSVIYPSGAPVYPANVNIDGTYLFTYMAGAGSSKWVLISSMNTASTSYSGLMSKDDKEKLDGIAEHANNYSLPAATDSNLGGVQLGYTTDETNRNYKLQTDKNGNGYVNVPWTDTHEANWVTDLKVGHPETTVDDTTSDTQDTYIKVVENNAVHGIVKVVGSGSVSVSSSGGALQIYGAGKTYNNLKESLNPTSINDNIPVTVPYPYVTNTSVKPTRFLNAEGNWVTPVTKLFNSQDGKSANVSISSGKVNAPIAIYTADGKRLFCLFIGTERVADVVITSNKIPDFSNNNIYIPFFPLGLEEDWNKNPGYDTRFKPGVIRIYRDSSFSTTAQVRIL